MIWSLERIAVCMSGRMYAARMPGDDIRCVSHRSTTHLMPHPETQVLPLAKTQYQLYGAAQ
jgi:hypothetical protein